MRSWGQGYVSGVEIATFLRHLVVSLIVPLVIGSILVEPLLVASIIVSKASSAFLVEPHFFLSIYFRFKISSYLLAFVDFVAEIRKFEFDLPFHFGDLHLRIPLFQKIHKFRVEERFLISDRHVVEFAQFFVGAVRIVHADGACVQKGAGFLFFAFWEEYAMRVAGMQLRMYNLLFMLAQFNLYFYFNHLPHSLQFEYP